MLFGLEVGGFRYGIGGLWLVGLGVGGFRYVAFYLCLFELFTHFVCSFFY